MTFVSNRAEQRGFRQSVSFCGSVIVGLLLAVAPKCPLCLGLYVSVCGAGAVNLLFYQRWEAPVLALLLVCNLGVQLHYARMQKIYGPFLVNLSGALVVAGGITLSFSEITFLGIVLVIIGSATGVYRAPQSNVKCPCRRNNSLNEASTQRKNRGSTLRLYGHANISFIGIKFSNPGLHAGFSSSLVPKISVNRRRSDNEDKQQA
jgi:hypothetical protein